MDMIEDSSDEENQLLDESQTMHVGTPLVHSSRLSVKLNSNIFLKMENIQPSGSVKMRGIGNFCYRTVQLRGTDIRFICGVGVNTALAVAYCARQLGVDAVIVLPKNTSESICDGVRLEGAHLILFGDDFNASESHARKLLKRNDVYVPSSDHAHIWQGHSTIIHELKTQLQNNPPAAIICPVGGGGLLNGVIMGLQEIGWKQVPVIAVETHGSNSFQSAVVAGKMVTLPRLTTIASSLAAKSVSSKSLELSLVHPVVPFAVSDAMAADAARLFADDNKTLVEAAAGAGLSLCYTQIIRDILPSLSPESDVVVLVTGGSDISLEKLDEYRKKYKRPPVVVKSGSEVFLKMDDSLTNVQEVNMDEPCGISKKALKDLSARQTYKTESMEDCTMQQTQDEEESYSSAKTPTPLQNN
ncbi:tryptophan synthase beta subunit-like PLP-dependent enzyme [Phycomyces nitens]|nr:tryptophan synthase beta subunit-like PLP-dependent enzyme [Phycomyces nitens]